MVEGNGRFEVLDTGRALPPLLVGMVIAGTPMVLELVGIYGDGAG